jgi:DnaA-like protein
MTLVEMQNHYRAVRLRLRPPPPKRVPAPKPVLTLVPKISLPVTDSVCSDILDVHHFHIPDFLTHVELATPTFVLKKVTADAIKVLVSRYTGVPVFDLESNRKPKHIVRARQIAMYLMRYHTPHSFARIGRLFGDRDHSTVLNAVWRVDLLCHEDPLFAYDVARINAIILDCAE